LIAGPPPQSAEEVADGIAERVVDVERGKGEVVDDPPYQIVMMQPASGGGHHLFDRGFIIPKEENVENDNAQRRRDPTVKCHCPTCQCLNEMEKDVESEKERTTQTTRDILNKGIGISSRMAMSKL
jgi:hypothetical protein